MEPFLKIVAQDLFKKKGNDMSRIAVVFPNKRAGLFFNEYLVEESDMPLWANLPLWSPAYLSISELFLGFSSLKTGDSIKLITELYKVFHQEMANDETLDDFYFWGELLLSDFDDVDKNLVNAEQLFANLKDLKQIMDDLDFLDEEQEAAIQQFFSNFSIERRTELKERFISIWDKLEDIYTQYKKNLTALGIAYEGMIYRDGIEKLVPENLPFDTYVFVGFNVLNKIEYKLFEELQNAGKALFYWDYDVFYTNNNQIKHEAGTYMVKNLHNFPSSLSTKLFDNLKKPKKIQFISSPTENAQARFLPEWAENIDFIAEKENAVVLCNESLLLPILHSIPEEISNVNITMGFPLSQTPAYTFVNALIELQTTGYDNKSGRYTFTAVETILKHPYTLSLSPNADALIQDLTANNRFYPLPSELQRDEILHQIFTPQNTLIAICNQVTELLKEITTLYRSEEDSDDVFNQLYRESLFKSYTIINRMLNLLENGELDVREDTFKRLVYKILLSTNIPFHGEPAIGMQIMGVLETRNLDFRNIIIMSFNEGLMPRSTADSSFIPFSLRKAFGMTTIEHQDAIYAYYFYRMIQRAENVTILYNTSSGGINPGEASRFMLQMQVEWPYPIEQKFLEAGQSPQKSAEITIAKTPDVIERLHQVFNLDLNKKANFTPSALNMYIDCGLKFYYNFIAGLKERKEVNTEVDSPTFGSIFHRSAELIYRKLTEFNRIIKKDDLEKLLKNDRMIQAYVDIAFKEIFFHIPEEEVPEYNGTQLINSKVIATYIKQLLRNDLQYAPFEMVEMEKWVSETIRVKSGDLLINTRIGGIIDRVDCKDNTLRIVDYKTGGSPKVPESIEELFISSEKRPNYIFQTFLYAAIMCRLQSKKVAPSLLYIHRAASETYSPVIEINNFLVRTPVYDFSVYEKEFRSRLYVLLEEIFNSRIPFTQTDNKRRCEFCDYKSLCKR
ncbi:PD-(D/E)XK nuclease family protein [Bacteroides sp. 519]|uniref:PD-(D/E)XK nuclease family protein n=1 Tax=Bacteroides sp. 519 TaxID=2302937 RepID=UPI0013D56C2E|nr:PD-(D/E)XK nuclease family protein [Bacteroides sp. 519]NDV59753.1 PD-(D/E)XK nuclease family protein [Bacteroides sp. 519]